MHFTAITSPRPGADASCLAGVGLFDIEIDVSCKNTDALQHNSVTAQDTEGGMDLLRFAGLIRKI